jgi:hypothetical protein
MHQACGTLRGIQVLTDAYVTALIAPALVQQFRMMERMSAALMMTACMYSLTRVGVIEWCISEHTLTASVLQDNS